jgi:hypothetical protein
MCVCALARGCVCVCVRARACALPLCQIHSRHFPMIQLLPLLNNSERNSSRGRHLVATHVSWTYTIRAQFRSHLTNSRAVINVQNYRADKSLGVRDREQLRPSRTSESRTSESRTSESRTLESRTSESRTSESQTVKFVYKGKRVFGTRRTRHASKWYIQ